MTLSYNNGIFLGIVLIMIWQAAELARTHHPCWPVGELSIMLHSRIWYVI